MRVSVIDIGSNTVKATIFDINKNKTTTVVSYKGIKAKLITFVKLFDGERIMTDEGKNKLYNCIGELTKFSDSLNCDRVFAFATASLRGLSNSFDIIEEIKNVYRLDVEILSGEEEALCSLKGLLGDECAASVESGVMVDMGGGSTEIVYFQNGSLPNIVSLPFGCLSLFETFVTGDIPTESEQKRIYEYVRSELGKCSYIKGIASPMFLIGGSARAILKLSNSKNKCLFPDGSDFTMASEKMYDERFFATADDIIPGRRMTVVPACIAYKAISDYICPASITVSDSGVREGYLEKVLP